MKKEITLTLDQVCRLLVLLEIETEKELLHSEELAKNDYLSLSVSCKDRAEVYESITRKIKEAEYIN